MTKKLNWLEVFNKEELIEFLSELIPYCDYLPKFDEEDFEFDYGINDVTEHPCYPLKRIILTWYESYIDLDSDNITKAFKD